MSDVSSNPIQLTPPGLLNWLQLKTGGINPDKLQREVQPSIDLEKWWLRAASRRVASTFIDLGAATYGAVQTFGPTMVVPNTSWWYVNNLTVRLAPVAAGATISRFGLGYNVPTAGGVSPTGDFLVNEPTYGTFTQPNIGILAARDFWVPPGGALGLWVDLVTVNAYRVLVTGLEITDLPL